MSRLADLAIPLALIAGLLMLAYAWVATEHPGPQPQSSAVDVRLPAPPPPGIDADGLGRVLREVVVRSQEVRP